MGNAEIRSYDADNHYYEPLDAFTRYIEPEFAERAVQFVQIEGKTRMLVGGKLNHWMKNPTFDPVSRPGIFDAYFRGQDPEALRKGMFDLEPIANRPEYRDRDARLRVLDQQGIEAALLFPTLAVGIEDALRWDVPALCAAFKAFNRWVAEDWGFQYKGRIFAAPFITLSDPDNAVQELEWSLENGAKVVLITLGPVVTPEGGRGQGDHVYDPFWARVQEAGIVVAFHGSDTRYNDYVSDWGANPEVNMASQSRQQRLAEERGEPIPEGEWVVPPRRLLCYAPPAGPIQDTIAMLLSTRLFHRFPGVRVAAIETGASWTPALYERLGHVFKLSSRGWPEDPRETMRRHVFVSAFGEDDLARAKETLGVDRLLFGSDWPHPEAIRDPTVFIDDMRGFGFTDADIRRVMRENTKELLGV
jgi:predicted TIM-barrel fold metal-dependent hydrolase